MRNAFIDELIKSARINSNIILMVGDLGFSVVEPFQDEFPDRFINAGVAEQNMMGVAAGLASEGCHVFVYSIANFPTFRCAEQIRNDVAYHNLPVTIVSVGGGVAYGNLGYSHHAVQDYGLLRAMPNMLIASPGDPFETRSCLRYITDHPQPSYLRLGKAGEKNINEVQPNLQFGQWNKLIEGSKTSEVAILTTGNGLQIAAEWVSGKEIIDCDLYSLPIWGMDSKKMQSEQVKRYKKIITVEDHLIDCGFGSWLMESVVGVPGLVERIEIRALSSEVCGEVAAQEVLHQKYGLHP